MIWRFVLWLAGRIDRLGEMTAAGVGKLDKLVPPPWHDDWYCKKAPPGWYCTRKSGHAGPCAARRCDDPFTMEPLGPV